MHVLFVEPFYGGSHRAFLDGLTRHSAHRYTLLTLPGGEWRRRMRRAAQELAPELERLREPVDLLVASDMLDLTTFLALGRHRLAGVPVLLYMHENQFTYPRIKGTKLNSWFGSINYLSALAADRVAFSSEYHRRDFLEALNALASEQTNWLLPRNVEEIAARSMVLPVGLELTRFDHLRQEARQPASPLVLWNHRWSFDKSPDMFSRGLVRLAAEGTAFRVAVAGESEPNPHPALVNLPAVLDGRVVHHGFAAGFEEYAGLLWNSHVVVSTTRHEFFGIGMVEALYCGCWPVAPRAFTYPDLVPEELHERCLFEGEEEFVEKLRRALTESREPEPALRASAARFDWSRVGPMWDRALRDLVR